MTKTRTARALESWDRLTDLQREHGELRRIMTWMIDATDRLDDVLKDPEAAGEYNTQLRRSIRELVESSPVTAVRGRKERA